jgi:hypothetical protein
MRAILLAAALAAVLPLTGTAHASCLDDATSRRVSEGYSPTPKERWHSGGWVEQTGPATVTVYGDALVNDLTLFLTIDVPNYADIVSGNAVDTAGDFANCVAG